MAKIQQTKNTALPSWKVSWFDGDQGMSRSKAIRDYSDALKYKELVEARGDITPSIGALSEAGLIQYAEWISPAVFVELKKMLDAAESDEAVARQVRTMVDYVLNER